MRLFLDFVARASASPSRSFLSAVFFPWRILLWLPGGVVFRTPRSSGPRGSLASLPCHSFEGYNFCVFLRVPTAGCLCRPRLGLVQEVGLLPHVYADARTWAIGFIWQTLYSLFDFVPSLCSGNWSPFPTFLFCDWPLLVVLSTTLKYAGV